MISIVFFTNYLFHHQYPLCREMLKQPDVEFTFVCCEPLTRERLLMGYEDMSNMSFVIRSYESNSAYQQAMKLAKEVDVAIFGSADLRFLYARMETNKLTFRYCERSLRKGAWRAMIPRTFKAIYQQYIRYRNKNLYILSASAYTSADLSLFGFLASKCFKWGYLPDVKRYEDIESRLTRKTQKSIIWVGRFIKCKHPEFALKAAKYLSAKGVLFNMTFIGDGPERGRCEKYVSDNLKNADIRFFGSMSPEEVRKHMEESAIFIFTSDRYEGWGAVLGEAMNSGCAVLASHACGSSPYLIEQNVNGRVYRYNDIKEFCSSLEEYLTDGELTHRLGLNAYRTMTETWNVEVAVPCLINLIRALQNDKDIPHYESGPCSSANIIRNNWYNRN